MKLLKNIEDNVDIAVKKLFSHININGIVFHVDIT